MKIALEIQCLNEYSEKTMYHSDIALVVISIDIFYE